ncbi:MAG: bifunctional demethylmenaquinone methyltransferase/2-methoxy-6-polyprenyl-1,4-benzoquinol methylase UbiE [Bacteroidales bacterium]|nr:bifunctional demethylmenaquinone methyltransferase/2-methoxy-6-polyprenyl-1,4-benzoquinol methylase UbiE [Bacteroidales bacterium]
MKGPKTENIETMFDSIAVSYDNLNHVLSLGIDRIWRLRSLKCFVDKSKPQDILDIACGTGDFSLDIARHSNEGTRVTGLDLSEGMLRVMKGKVDSSGLGTKVTMLRGNGEMMDFPDGSFDAVTIGFGIRNFENRETALKEILRVLKPGGKLVILELSVPKVPIIKNLYKAYLTGILPVIGGKVSGDASAYRYLPSSILKFPKKKEWMAIMSSCGFGNVSHRAFSMGICRMYFGVKQP